MASGHLRSKQNINFLCKCQYLWMSSSLIWIVLCMTGNHQWNGIQTKYFFWQNVNGHYHKNWLISTTIKSVVYFCLFRTFHLQISIQYWTKQWSWQIEDNTLCMHSILIHTLCTCKCSHKYRSWYLIIVLW